MSLKNINLKTKLQKKIFDSKSDLQINVGTQISGKKKHLQIYDSKLEIKIQVRLDGPSLSF